MTTNSDDTTWEDAINEEYGTDLKPEEPNEDDKDAAAAANADDAANDDAANDDSADDDSDNSGDDDETEEEKAARIAKEEADAAAADDAADDDAKPNTRDEIKEAMRELEAEKASHSTQRETLKKEVLDSLYPEGINRQLLDSDGDPITGIDDLTKLINPKTDDYFTEEEAGAWLLSAQQQLNKDIEQLENYADEVAETHLTLREAAAYIEESYGDLLKSMPEVADKVYAAYEKTLVKDPNSGIVIKAPVDATEFYDLALQGYKQVADQMTVQKQAEEAAKAKAAEEAAKAAQADRGDLKPAGKSKLPKGEDEWGDAYEEYFNG